MITTEAMVADRPEPKVHRACRRLAGWAAWITKAPSFNFLGFTFICGKSRRGHFQLKRKTRRDRMRTRLREIKEAARSATSPAR